MREKLKDITAGIERIRPAGDYKWISLHDGRVWGLERKEISDFITSFASGRLTEQLRGLLDEADIQVPILLIEGTYSQTNTGTVLLGRRNNGVQAQHFKYSTIQDILLEAQMLGVYLQFSTSVNDSATQIRRLYNWSHRDDHTLITGRRRRHLEYGTRLNQQEQFIANMPGIGADMAQMLLDQFLTPWNVLNMFAAPGGLQFLKEVKGLGPGKISTVRKLLGVEK